VRRGRAAPPASRRPGNRPRNRRSFSGVHPATREAEMKRRPPRRRNGACQSEAASIHDGGWSSHVGPRRHGRTQVLPRDAGGPTPHRRRKREMPRAACSGRARQRYGARTRGPLSFGDVESRNELIGGASRRHRASDVVDQRHCLSETCRPSGDLEGRYWPSGARERPGPGTAVDGRGVAASSTNELVLNGPDPKAGLG